MHILLYCVLSAQGGVETHVSTLAKILSNNGHTVTLAAKWARNSDAYVRHFAETRIDFVFPKILNTHFAERFVSNKLRNLLQLVELRIRLCTKRFELIAIHAQGAVGPTLRSLLQPGGHITYHQHVVLPEIGLLMQELVSSLLTYDFVTVNSARDQRILSNCGLRTILLPALSNASCESALPKTSASYTASSNFRVGFVGNLASQMKGAYRLLELWRDNPPENCSLHLFGPGAVAGFSGPLPTGATIHGPFPPELISEVFAKFDVLVHPAENESLGLILLESLAHGVPFIASYVGGMADVLDTCEDCMRTTTDTMGLRQSILRMRERYISGSIDFHRIRATYDKNYSIGVLGKRWVETYELADTVAVAKS